MKFVVKTSEGDPLTPSHEHKVLHRAGILMKTFISEAFEKKLLKLKHHRVDDKNHYLAETMQNF